MVASAALLAVIALASAVVSWWQATATSSFLRGRPDVQLRAPAGLVASVVAADGIVVLMAASVLVLDIDEVATQTVRVQPVRVTGAPLSSPGISTEVRFQPVRTGDDSPVVVNVGNEVESVELDAGLDYRITATATGAEDCATTITPGRAVKEVRVTCARSGTLLRRTEK